MTSDPKHRAIIPSGSQCQRRIDDTSFKRIKCRHISFTLTEMEWAKYFLPLLLFDVSLKCILVLRTSNLYT